MRGTIKYFGLTGFCIAIICAALVGTTNALTSSNGPQVISGGVSSNQGTPTAASSAWPVKPTDSGGVNQQAIDATGNASVNLGKVAGVATATGSTAGSQKTEDTANGATGSAVPARALLEGGSDGTNLTANKTASLANFPTSTTLTARNSSGALQAEKGSRWAVISNPAVGFQATASIAAEVGVRHVADCIAFSAGSTTAPVLTSLTINLRDGATGAGTVIWTYIVTIPASTGTDVAPFSVCGLNLVGTTNTALTFEFSAGLANLAESVSVSGFNVN